MIKVEHTLFALPFACMGTMLGAMVVHHHLPPVSIWGWIFLAMFGARSAAMALNRLIDAAIDAKNPRTAHRAIPAGLLKIGEVLSFTMVSFCLLFWAATHLAPLCVYLLPVATFMLVFYSFTKRFTWLCHVVLGFTVALAPLGGWIAVTNQMTVVAFVLYMTITCWIAGFDIIYACQDYKFDKQEGLQSIPVRFGVAQSLWIARGCHMLTAIGFMLLLWMTQLSWWYFIGTSIASALLIYEHILIKPQHLHQINKVFFTINAVVSILVFGFTWLDLVVFHS